MKSSQALAAKQIRQILKKNFPNVKFSVTSEGYSMGDNVNVKYTDFKPTKEIESLIKKFQYGSFDGMKDLYNFDNVDDSIPQTKYLFVNRKMSEQVRESLLKEIQSTYSQCENLGYNDYSEHWNAPMSTLIHRLFAEREF